MELSPQHLQTRAAGIHRCCLHPPCPERRFQVGSSLYNPTRSLAEMAWAVGLPQTARLWS